MGAKLLYFEKIKQAAIKPVGFLLVELPALNRI